MWNLQIVLKLSFKKRRLFSLISFLALRLLLRNRTANALRLIKNDFLTAAFIAMHALRLSKLMVFVTGYETKKNNGENFSLNSQCISHSWQFYFNPRAYNGVGHWSIDSLPPIKGFFRIRKIGFTLWYAETFSGGSFISAPIFWRVICNIICNDIATKLALNEIGL